MGESMMALLTAKKKAAKREVVSQDRFRVVVATYVSRHRTKAEASSAMQKIKLKGDDIAFIVEEQS
jgi:endonuclease III